jgi:predicted CoA-binding protein
VKTVAVIGASQDPRKFGNKAVRAFRHQGYQVVPINPHHEEIEGLKAYPSVLDVPMTIDMATLYVPPRVGIRVVGEVARKQIPELWLNPGADGPEVIRRARELGLEPIIACSLIGIGESPAAY